MVTSNSGRIEVEIPSPTKEDKVRDSHHEPSQGVFQHSQNWLVILAVVSVVALATILAIKQWRQQKKTKGWSLACPRPNCRRPSRCVASSDCCDGASISSSTGAYTEQTESPTRSKHTQEDKTGDSLPNLNNPAQHTLLPLQNNLVVADVHHISQSDGTDSRSPGYITEAEVTFDSSGGQLIAPDSDVVITVGSGAVQEGIKRRFFFRVLKDDSTLLKDIPDVPEGTLISPVIECGPHGVTLLKPVEISVPHDLCLDEVRKDLIRVYRWEPSSKGPPQWEKIPSASEKNCQSKAWFTVKKNSILIKTKKFSIWSVFACGGTKRKRATVYFSRHNPRSDHIYLRFYIYSDNEDSKKRVKAQEKESFPGSRSSKEKPFKMYDDEKDVIVKLTDLEDGWELDKTPSLQKYNYDTAYRNGFRAKDACDFAVRPARPGVKEFSCNLKFNQEDSPTEYSIYLYPGYSPRQTGRNIFVQNSESGTFSNGRKVAGAVSITMPPEENEINGSQETITSMDSSANQTESFSYDISSLGSDRQPVTEDHFHCIREEIGAKWKNVLRKLGLREPEIENICVNHKEYGVEESFFQGLLKWKKRFGEEATTEKLCDVLREARCTEALKKLRELSCRV